MRRTAVIVNPKSAGGRTGRRWKRLRPILERRLGAVEARFTEAPGHAIELARDLARGGFDLIVGVGGDGTYNEIANGLLFDHPPPNPEAALGLLPLGTGGDFQRTLGIPSSPELAVEVLARGRCVEIDAGLLTYRTPDGRTARRYFVNLVSFGMGGEVAARSSNFLSPLGGKAAFFYATLQVFGFYRGKRVELELGEGGEPRRYHVLNVAIGNGRYHGGGMDVCPRAVLTDGLLEVTVIDDLSLVTLLKDLAYLYNGKIYEHPKVRHFRAAKVVARSAEITRIEVDGEPLGVLPIEVSLLPRRLKVLAPAGS
jgi:YegS/Rv2252/BmrU family lipid kinase